MIAFFTTKPSGSGTTILVRHVGQRRSSTRENALTNSPSAMPGKLPIFIGIVKIGSKVKNGPSGRGHGKPPRPSPELRVRAAEILLDRAFGKAKEILELQGDDAAARQERLTLIASMSQDDRDALRALLLKALEARAQAPPVLGGAGR